MAEKNIFSDGKVIQSKLGKQKNHFLLTIHPSMITIGLKKVLFSNSSASSSVLPNLYFPMTRYFAV